MANQQKISDLVKLLYAESNTLREEFEVVVERVLGLLVGLWGNIEREMKKEGSSSSSPPSASPSSGKAEKETLSYLLDIFASLSCFLSCSPKCLLSFQQFWLGYTQVLFNFYTFAVPSLAKKAGLYFFILFLFDLILILLLSIFSTTKTKPNTNQTGESESFLAVRTRAMILQLFNFLCKDIYSALLSAKARFLSISFFFSLFLLF